MTREELALVSRRLMALDLETVHILCIKKRITTVLQQEPPCEIVCLQQDALLQIAEDLHGMSVTETREAFNEAMLTFFRLIPKHTVLITEARSDVVGDMFDAFFIIDNVKETPDRGYIKFFRLTLPAPYDTQAFYLTPATITIAYAANGRCKVTYEKPDRKPIYVTGAPKKAIMAEYPNLLKGLKEDETRNVCNMTALGYYYSRCWLKWFVSNETEAVEQPKDIHEAVASARKKKPKIVEVVSLSRSLTVRNEDGSYVRSKGNEKGVGGWQQHEHVRSGHVRHYKKSNKKIQIKAYKAGKLPALPKLVVP